MYKVWFFLLVVLLGFGFVIRDLKPRTDNDYDTVARSALVIEGNVKGQWVPIGSGVAVRNSDRIDSVLTALHVANRSKVMDTRACAINNLGDCVSLDIFLPGPGSGVGGDWALFETELPAGVRVARTRRSRPILGETIQQIGSPSGTLWYNEGVVSSINQEGREYYGISGFALGGSSGSGIYDKRGRLIGIVVSISVRPNPLGLPQYIPGQVYMSPISEMDF